MKLHEKLYHLRKKKGLTQAELAEQLEVSRQSVSNWEGSRYCSTFNKKIERFEPPVRGTAGLSFR